MVLKKIFDIHMRMASITRYSQIHLVMKESVLEHTGGVSLFCLMIGISIDKRFKIDYGKLLSAAAVHDIDEIITGDIPRPTKYENENITKEIKNVENKNMQLISKDIFNNKRIFDIWNTSKDNSIEGDILIIADLLSVLYKLWQETVLYNNKTMVGHINNIGDVLKELDKKYSKKYMLHRLFEEANFIYEEIKDNAY